MAWFQGDGKVGEAVEDMKKEMDYLREDLLRFKNRIEAEVNGLKKNFEDLIRYLEESTSEDTDEESPDIELPVSPSSGEESATVGGGKSNNMETDMKYIKENIEFVVAWTKEAEKEFKSLKTNIVDAKKDIKNKVSYAVSRIKSP